MFTTINSTPIRAALATATTAAAAACLVAGSALPASAHASAVGASISDGQVLSPSAAARTFTVRFNESVSANAGSMAVRSATGTVMSGAASGSSAISVRTKSGLKPGRYALEYSVTSQDGHPVSRAIGFAVGVGTPAAAAKAVSMSSGSPRVTISGGRVGQRTIKVAMPAGGTGGEVRLTCQSRDKVRAPFIWQLSASGSATGYLPMSCTYSVSVTVDRAFPRFPSTYTGSVGIGA